MSTKRHVVESAVTDQLNLLLPVGPHDDDEQYDGLDDEVEGEREPVR